MRKWFRDEEERQRRRESEGGRGRRRESERVREREKEDAIKRLSIIISIGANLSWCCCFGLDGTPRIIVVSCSSFCVCVLFGLIRDLLSFGMTAIRCKGHYSCHYVNWLKY